MVDFFKVDEKVADDSILVLIIYDIENNKKRTKLAKHLQRYGFRVQKSAFEGIIKENKYDKLVKELAVYGSDEDSVRIFNKQTVSVLENTYNLENYTLSPELNLQELQNLTSDKSEVVIYGNDKVERLPKSIVV